MKKALRDSGTDTEVPKKLFIVCPNENCNALYQPCDSVKTCTQRSYRKICGKSLGYFANIAHGKRKWKYHKVFQFIPPSASLKKMCKSTEFVSLLGRVRAESPQIIEDVQDGRIWKDFSNFFDNKFHIGLMMNVDWFCPFKRSEYKVAAILLTVLNLPREERFKKKWTILAGI